MPVAKAGNGEKRAYNVISFDSNYDPVLEIGSLQAVLCSEEAKNRKVAIISICGSLRQGKSFLMNFFLRYLKKISQGEKDWMKDDGRPLEGFNWKFSKDSVTSGINVWPEVFVINDVAVILVDTQGTFDENAGEKADTAVVSISTIFSSIQIFNFKERLNSQDLSNVQYFIEFGQLLQDENRGMQKMKAFQHILFLIRDWKYKKDYEYGFEGGDKYLNSLLTGKEGKESCKNAETVRNSLNVFENIQCFLMPHPGNSVDTNDTFIGKLEEVSEEFLKFTPVLVEHFMKNLAPKKVAGKLVTGSELKTLLQAYVNNFKNGVAPKPQSMIKIWRDQIYDQIVEACLEKYLGAITPKVALCKSVDHLLELHDSCRQMAVRQFDSSSLLGDDEYVTSAKGRLIKKIGDHLALVKKDVQMKALEIKLKSEMRDIEKACETKINIITTEAEKARREYELKFRKIAQEKVELKHEIEKVELKQRMTEQQSQRDREQNERRLKELKENLERKEQETLALKALGSLFEFGTAAMTTLINLDE